MTAMSETKRYQAYPEYKDSGVEWLGKVPLGWKTQRLKYLCAVTTGDRDNIHKCDDGEFPFFVRSKKVERINSYSFDGEAVLTAGDGDIGKIFHYVDGKFDFHQRVYKFSDFDNVSGKYFYHYLSCHLADEVVKLSAKTTVDSLRLPMLQNFVFCVPSEEEQTKIANFLDHETAKIDTLIDKQQQLIKLLKEKRQAVISHAVTKGLNPEAPMKDSGVEWFDNVPLHWKVSKFSYLAQVVRGGSPRPAGDPILFDGNYSPWVTVAEITKDSDLYLNQTSSFLTKKGSEQCRVFKAGTLLISNSGATLGVPKILRINANANDGVVGFEGLKLNTEFAYFYLSTLTERLRTQIKSTGGSTQINLNTDIIKEISAPVPPQEEMHSIVDYIFEQIDVFAKLMSKAETAIQLMKERRTALISATVTGKIDVRNWQAPENKEQLEAGE